MPRRIRASQTRRILEGMTSVQRYSHVAVVTGLRNDEITESKRWLSRQSPAYQKQVAERAEQFLRERLQRSYDEAV